MRGDGPFVVSLRAVEGSYAVDGGGVQAVVFQYLVVAFHGLGGVAALSVGLGKDGVEADVAGIAAQSLFHQFDGRHGAVFETVEGAEVVVGVGQCAVLPDGGLEVSHGLGIIPLAVLDIAHHVLPPGGVRVGLEGSVGPGNGHQVLVAVRLHVGHHRHGQGRGGVLLDGALGTMRGAVNHVAVHQAEGLVSLAFGVVAFGEDGGGLLVVLFLFQQDTQMQGCGGVGSLRQGLTVIAFGQLHESQLFGIQPLLCQLGALPSRPQARQAAENK